MKKKRKYYIIRSEIIWIYVGLLVGVIILLGFNIIYRNSYNECQKNYSCVSSENDTTSNGTNVLYSGMKSKLKNKKSCNFCGKGSLAQYFRNSDAIGIVSLNDWDVVEIKFDLSSKNRIGDSQNYNFSRSGYIGDISYNSESMPSRGMTTMEMNLPSSNSLNVSYIRRHLCQKCLNKVAEAIGGLNDESKGKEIIPLCLVDYKTLKIYSLQERYFARFVRDYWIENIVLDDSRKLKINAFYLPKR